VRYRLLCGRFGTAFGKSRWKATHVMLAVQELSIDFAWLGYGRCTYRVEKAVSRWSLIFDNLRPLPESALLAHLDLVQSVLHAPRCSPLLGGEEASGHVTAFPIYKPFTQCDAPDCFLPSTQMISEDGILPLVHHARHLKTLSLHRCAGPFTSRLAQALSAAPSSCSLRSLKLVRQVESSAYNQRLGCNHEMQQPLCAH
jgi:hypothetical protein